MKTFYLLRHEDLHGHSGLGTVAEGVIFDNGLIAMTWISEFDTVTMFRHVRDVVKLHSHDGRTEMVIEGRKRDKAKFDKCKEEARLKKSVKNHKEDQDESN